MKISKLYSRIARSRPEQHSFYTRKKKVVDGLLKTSFSSFSIYDFLQHKVVYSQWNLLRSLGYSPDEFQEVSRNFFRKILHPDDVCVVEKHFQKINESAHGKVLRCLIRIKNKQGKYRWIAIRDTAVCRNRHGQVSHLAGSVVDVSHYKVLKRRISKKDQALSRLSYRASHDLRGPVATAKGLISLMKHDLSRRKEYHEVFESLEKTLDKMDEVVKDFGYSLNPKTIIGDDE